MKLRLLTPTLALVLAAFSLAACASSEQVILADPPGTQPPGTQIGTEQPPEEEDDVTKQPPHSLGTIILGETHMSGASKATPLVSAVFVPDALLTKKCAKKIDSCEIVAAPKCGTGSSGTTGTGCLTGEVCAWDDSCTAVCQKVPVCTTACKTGEYCKLTQKTGTSTSGTCVKQEAFDAGPLAFSGTTTPITMFPPYAFESEGQGAPFLAGTELRVQASGATEAGFEAFDEKFKATTFLQTTPALSKIDQNKVFGSGDVPIAWMPGADSIIITVSGAGGSATCKAKDADGSFDLPRAVVKAAQGDASTGTVSSSISISVSRQRKEVKKDKKAKGELTITPVIPEAWVEMVTLSTETASFQGCPTAGQLYCDGTCTAVATDRYNCGECGNACATTETCSAGKCTASGSSSSCDSCLTSYCSSYRTTCLSDSYCSALKTCYESCGIGNTTCQSSCRSSYPSGTTRFDSLNSCKASYCTSYCSF